MHYNINELINLRVNEEQCNRTKRQTEDARFLRSFKENDLVRVIEATQTERKGRCAPTARRTVRAPIKT